MFTSVLGVTRALLLMSLAFLAVEGALVSDKPASDPEKLQRRQDYGDYGDDYVGALLEEGDDEDDAVLYAAFAYDVDDDGGEAVYDYGDADYEGSEKKEKTANGKSIEKRKDQDKAAINKDDKKTKAGSR